ncbi:MAG: hypothetical protein AAF674_22565 [Pseudomonadota bacterium]
MTDNDLFKIIDRVDRLAKRRWKIAPDLGRDDWTVAEPEVLQLLKNGQDLDLEGDCENLAMVALIMAIAAGVPKDRLDLVIVKADGEGYHAVAALRHGADLHDWRLFGDTLRMNRGPVNWTDRLGYRRIMWLHLNDLNTGWVK